MNTIDHRHVEIALSRVGGHDFEQFINALLAATTGVEYVPLGGVHDGGADGLFGSGIYRAKPPEGTVTSDSFLQASIQADHRQKIRDTVNRLRESGRDPRMLTYVTPQSVKLLDQDEVDMMRQTGAFVRIRDGKWIIAHINHSPATIEAFNSYLRKELDFLQSLGQSTPSARAPHVDARTVCVFLRQQVERRSGEEPLIEPILDGLILWALEGTDPDKGRLASLQEILSKIESVLPSAKHYVDPSLEDRLRQMSSKTNPGGREVRIYMKDGLYCLPYETRKLVSEEKIEDESLRARALSRLEERVQELDDIQTSPRMAAEVALRAIELTFETRGLELAAFLEQKIGDPADLSIADCVEKAIDERANSGTDVRQLRAGALEALSGAFYRSTEEERSFFSKLCRTYSLLFSLQVEPRIVKYFEHMTANFVLLVGTDILVRALSERYLRSEDQMTCNLLKMLREAGASLILTQPVAEEVHKHVEGCDYEFQNYFAAAEAFVTLEIARNAPKMLVRSYFYARLSPADGVEGPRSWSEFIHQICDMRALHSRQHGREQITDYLLEKFDLEYVTTEELTQYSTEEGIEELADQLALQRGGPRVLAVNDLKMAFGVYDKRKDMGERRRGNPYGYRTWWLTQEMAVRRVTRELVERHGAEYIMRPEFLVDFMALSPTTTDVRDAYERVFPTVLGIRLSNRVREEDFHAVLREFKKMQETDEARARVMLRHYSDRLKSDPSLMRARPDTHGNWD